MKSELETKAEKADDYKRTFLAIRKGVGILGFLLPVSLLGISWVRGSIEPSISQYYFTEGRDFFFGTLFAIGGFFLSYKGYPRRNGERFSDRVLATCAGLAALGVAFVPTKGDSTPWVHGIIGPDVAMVLHYASAVSFFLCLGIFSYFQFPKGNGETRKRVFKICGIVIFASLCLMLLIVLTTYFTSVETILDSSDAIFWLETIGVFAFATAWLVKGRLQTPAKVMALIKRVPAGFPSK